MIQIGRYRRMPLKETQNIRICSEETDIMDLKKVLDIIILEIFNPEARVLDYPRQCY
jgi:hypothetical protein